MEKSFYYNHAAVINKNLTTLSTTSDQKKTKEAVNNLISLIKSPDAVTEIKIEEKEMHQMLAELNKIFTEDKYKKALLREFSTGEKRFSAGEKCVADHIMTWDCQGDCLIYTVDEFINDNYNKIKFGVRDRGNARGGSLRIGILKEECDETDYLLLENQIIEESLMSFINNLGVEFKNVVQNSLEFVKSSGDAMSVAVNQPILESIFYKNSPLHDGAMLIEGNTITATRVILPVSDDKKIPLRFGLRHRAAVGVSEKSDAVCLVVSEENGQISYLKDGDFVLYETLEQLTEIIHKDLS